MLKVVHIQYSTNSAGRAALRLQNEFIKANITFRNYIIANR